MGVLRELVAELRAEGIEVWAARPSDDAGADGEGETASGKDTGADPAED